jgi:aspartate/methionine/tyrosine aminotransferase
MIIVQYCRSDDQEIHAQRRERIPVDIEELKGLNTEKTKMMVIVSPSNPLGASLTTENLPRSRLGDRA